MRAAVSELSFSSGPIRRGSSADRRPSHALGSCLRKGRRRVLRGVGLEISARRANASLTQLCFTLRRRRLLANYSIAAFRGLLTGRLPGYSLGAIQGLRVSVGGLGSDAGEKEVGSGNVRQSLVGR